MTAPKLRFKEFDGDWLPYVLKDFGSFRKGKGISKADISEDGINECIRYGELYTTYGQVITKVQSKTHVSKSECVLSQAGDVLIPASGETQIDIATASCVLKEDVILSGDLNILSHKENGEWLAYYLSSAKKLDIAQLAQGNSVVHLYSSQLKDLKINKPSKAEQTKIAAFLSAVDEKISQLSQKHVLLSQYKQGMMQKLFSQQIRFKADDGSEFGEWEEKKLSEICIKIKDGTHFSPKTFEVGDYKYLTSKNVKNGYLDFSKLEYVNKEEHLKIYSSCDVQFGDVLLTKDGTIGQCCVNTLREEFSLLSSVAFLRLQPEYYNYFLYHLFVSDFGQKEINGAIAGQALKRITLTKINDFSFSFPCLEEQTKIANFLSSIDQKIEVVAQQIEQAKQWKKGLLQQMFV